MTDVRDITAGGSSGDTEAAVASEVSRGYFLFYKSLPVQGFV